VTVGPLGFISSAAATSLPAKASEVDRAGRDAAEQQRKIQADRSAADAAGISQADGEDHQSSERDADGRLPWQQSAAESEESPPEAAPRRASAPLGETGNLLDLTG